MFTGIITHVGCVDTFSDGVLRIVADDRPDELLHGVVVGESIAVDGCCLTVTEVGDDWFTADVSTETVSRTRLADVLSGEPVNLERAVRLDDRLGGHLVQGHVDGVGVVVEPCPDLRVSVPDDLRRYLVEKGSVTVDGVSLTVVDALDDGFTVAVIPHTAEVTTLGRRRVGDRVNLEVDVMAKYVERLVEATLADRVASAEAAVR